MEKIIPQLQEFVQDLYNNWFTIITTTYESFKDDPHTYFYAFKNWNFVYIQYDRYMYSITTVNKPSRDHGTGTQISTDYPTISNVERAMSIKHFNDRKNQPIYYSTLQEFINYKSRGCEVKTFTKE